MVPGYVADVVITLPVAVSREQRDDADVIGDGRVTALDALIILPAVSYHNLTEHVSLKSHLRSG